MSKPVSYRILSQEDTPSSWILGGKMFRIKSWEIKKEEIDRLCSTIIKGKYELNQIHSKDGDLKGITLLFISDRKDVEKIRKTILVTESGTELRKTSQLANSFISTRTIKTTAPVWVTSKKILKVFSKYNSDPTLRTLIVDKKEVNDVQYPIVRFFPTVVDRNGSKTKVNVIYIEFSPKESCKYDSFIALSMGFRCNLVNNISGEEATLIFDRWTVDKIKDTVEDKDHDRLRIYD
jgi:leucyl aminopeptidase